MIRVNSDEEDYYMKPDGFEWKKVLEKNPLKEPTGFETTAVEGPNIIKAKEGKEIKFFISKVKSKKLISKNLSLFNGIKTLRFALKLKNKFVK